jgi:hypothetical protein
MNLAWYGKLVIFVKWLVIKHNWTLFVKILKLELYMRFKTNFFRNLSWKFWKKNHVYS